MRRIRQRGLSLVEVLVAAAIGVSLASALVTTYLANLKASRSALALAQMAEDGHAALSLIAHHLRQAGYAPRWSSASDSGLDTPGGRRRRAERNAAEELARVPPVFACDGGFAVPGVTTGELQCGPPGDNTSLSVAYVGDRYNSTLVEATGWPSDCVGSGIVPTGEDAGVALIQNRIFLDRGNLMCVGNGGKKPFSAPQPFVENIEELRLYFATRPVAASTDDMVSGDGYIRASAIQALLPDANASASIDLWRDVVSVRVCVLLRSADSVLDAGGKPIRYADCEGVQRESSDGRLRRAFSTTVYLRSREIP